VENCELYILSFKGLSLGSHVFEWTINGSFFTLYEMSEISDASIHVQLTLVRHTRFLELNFIMNGWAEVNCDRCLEPLRLDMESDARMFVKFGEQEGEDESDDDDVIILPYDEDRLDVAQYLYEYAHLSLPIRRVHPDDANGDSTCNAEMLSKLNEYLVNSNR
jgi:uncharacterized metal-binding protein YceD (DUF177 family)